MQIFYFKKRTRYVCIQKAMGFAMAGMGSLNVIVSVIEDRKTKKEKLIQYATLLIITDTYLCRHCLYNR